jgi:hypothetical protein
MQWRIINKTMIQKVFTAMIATFLITIILFIGRSYVIATICLAGFCFLFWKWRQLINEAMVLSILAQNNGQMFYSVLVERLSKERVDDGIKQLMKKDFVKVDQGRVMLVEMERTERTEGAPESQVPK